MPSNEELLAQYLDLITSEHNAMPRYMATVAFSLRPFIDAQLEACRIIGLYDLDTANGQQLDFTGQWIGLSRFLQVEAEIWFSFDTRQLGFDEGRWMVPFEEQFNIIRLADEDYRNLLRAKVLANYWDGTIPGAYRAWDQLFGASGYKLAIQDQGARPEAAAVLGTGSIWDQGNSIWDNAGSVWDAMMVGLGGQVRGNMHVWQILFGPPLSPVTQILFEGGYLGLKSAGVGTGYMIQSQPNSGFDGTNLPMFAFDTQEESTEPPIVPPVGPQTTWDESEGGTIWDDDQTKWDVVTRAAENSPRLEYPDILFAGFDRGAWGQVLSSGITISVPPKPPEPPEGAQTTWDDSGTVWDSGQTLWDRSS